MLANTPTPLSQQDLGDKCVLGQTLNGNHCDRVTALMMKKNPTAAEQYVFQKILSKNPMTVTDGSWEGLPRWSCLTPITLNVGESSSG